MLSAVNIDASYGRKQVLFRASISIEEQDRLLLVGPNGAGKSTLLQVLVGLLVPSVGKIEFSGRNISSWSTRKRITSGIGYLLQSENIVPGLSVRENILLGGYSIKRNVLATRQAEILDVFGFLKDKLDVRAGLLSGGERQALAISMVLMQRPRLLLLDEPSAGLSPKAASSVLENIKHAQDVMGVKAVCMVEHNLKVSLKWANKIVVLIGGKVAHVSDEPGIYLKQPQKLEKYFFKKASEAEV